jgi:DNA primase
MSDLDITDSALAELRSAADIVEVIGEHTKLKKAGRSWKGLCPFHKERTPSFTVDRDKGLYHCFGCGAGGDVIHFVRQIDRLDFPEAVEALAARFHVAIPKRVSRGPRDDRREKLYEALAAAHRFYMAELAKPQNRAAKYLDERGVTPDMARRLGLGYAPDSWDALSRALTPAFPEGLLVEAGLLQMRPEGKGAYDRFRQRLIFVVRDERGRPVGFGGRALAPEAEPKYLNSPESPVFSKKRLLYGLSEAREAIRRHERVVLVEGYFDHLAVLSAGIDEAVASMGTALTEEQAAKLYRLCPRVTLCYDGDSAGRAATRSALKHLLGQGFEAKVARLTEGEDPHDSLRREGAARLAERIDQAPDSLTWLLEDAKPEEEGLSSGERANKISAVLEIVGAIPDAIVRHEECRRISQRVAIPLEVLWEKVKPKAQKTAPKASPTPSGTSGNPGVLSPSGLPAAERRLLQVLMGHADYNPLILRTLKDEYLTHPIAQRLVRAFRQSSFPSEVVDFQRQIAHLTEEERILVSGIALEETPAPNPRGVERLLSDLERKYLERESAQIQSAIDRAETAGGEELAQLIRRKQEISTKKLALARAQRGKGKELGD